MSPKPPFVPIAGLRNFWKKHTPKKNEDPMINIITGDDVKQLDTTHNKWYVKSYVPFPLLQLGGTCYRSAALSLLANTEALDSTSGEIGEFMKELNTIGLQRRHSSTTGITGFKPLGELLMEKIRETKGDTFTFTAKELSKTPERKHLDLRHRFIALNFEFIFTCPLIPSSLKSYALKSRNVYLEKCEDNNCEFDSTLVLQRKNSPDDNTKDLINNQNGGYPLVVIMAFLCAGGKTFDVKCNYFKDKLHIVKKDGFTKDFLIRHDKFTHEPERYMNLGLFFETATSFFEFYDPPEGFILLGFVFGYLDIDENGSDQHAVCSICTKDDGWVILDSDESHPYTYTPSTFDDVFKRFKLAIALYKRRQCPDLAATDYERFSLRQLMALVLSYQDEANARVSKRTQS